MTKQLWTNPLQLQKMPLEPIRPGQPKATPSVLTLIQPGGGAFQWTSITLRALKGQHGICKVCKTASSSNLFAMVLMLSIYILILNYDFISFLVF